jgi:threonine dehydrogenase-like Zn-dependent dehydrogenase
VHAITARTSSDVVHWREVPNPALKNPNDVICKTIELGICGTDREVVAGQRPLCPPGETQLILGHECLARVVALADGVDDLRVGDLVTPVVRRLNRPEDDSAESIDLARGAPRQDRPDLAKWGEFVERGIVLAHGFSSPFWVDQPGHLVRVPESLAGVAVLTEPQAVAEKAANEAAKIQSARLDLDWEASSPRVLVLGLGPIGFACVLAGLGRGWPVTIMGRDSPDSFRASLAREFGASYQRIQADTFPSSLDAPEGPYDLILECTGSESLLATAAPLLASCGAAVWLAANRQPRPTETELAKMMRLGIIRNHLHLGSVNAAPRDIDQALRRLEQFLHSHPAALKSLITKRVAPRDSLEDFVRREPQGVKVVVEFD